MIVENAPPFLTLSLAMLFPNPSCLAVAGHVFNPLLAKRIRVSSACLRSTLR